MSWSLSKPKEEVSIVFDIGCGTVGGSLVKFRKGEKPHTLYSCRLFTPIFKRPNSARLSGAMLKTLGKVCHILSREGVLIACGMHRCQISEILFTLSSPWTLTKTKVIKIKKEEEVIITPEMIKEIVTLEEKNLLESLRQGAYESELGSDATLIEQKIIHIKLNGYETALPYQKKAHTIEVPLLMSFSSKNLMDKIERMVAHHFNYKHVIWHSFTLLSYATVRDVFHAENDFIFLDVNAELTDIYIVKNNVLLQTSSFPMGLHSILHYIGEKMHTIPEVAESLLRLYYDKKSDDAHNKKIEPLLDEVKRLWLDKFHEMLLVVREEISLPQSIFLISSNALSQMFFSFLQKELPTRYGAEDATFKIILLNHALLQDYCITEKNQAPHAFLSLETIALSKFLNLKS